MSPRTLESLPIPRIRLIGLGAGVAGLVLCAAGFFVNRPQFGQSWLMAHQFFLALALGGLALAMIHHLMGGQWGILTGRIFESMAMTLPLMALLFLPVFASLHGLYEWTDAAKVAATPHLQAKRAYLNVPFFAIRAAGYFTLWCALALTLRRGSLARDYQPDPAIDARLMRTSTIGLILYFLTMTFAAIDWLMSLEPEWFSTIFGATIIIGQGLQALALGAIMLYLVGEDEAILPRLSTKSLLDMGNLLMAFVVLWAYMAFVQYLIIWMANLNEEIPWVLHRQRGGWQAIGIGLIVLNFFLPFFLLLFPGVKTRLGRTAAVGGLVLVMRLAGTQWLIAPSFHERFSIHWLDLAALAAVGGLWTAVFATSLAGARPVPRHDPRAHEFAALES